MKFFLCVLGMVLFIEGFPYAAFPSRMKFWVLRIAGQPSGALRALGLIMMMIGLALVFIGKR